MIEDVAAIVPCFNESPRLARVLEQLRGLGIFTVLIDDGSRDGSGDIAEAHGATVIRNSENIGYTRSILRGFDALLTLGARRLITIDGDHAHDASDLVRLLRSSDSFDMAIGDRFLSGALVDYETKHIANIFACHVFFRSLGRAVPSSYCDITSGLRVFGRDFAKALVVRARHCTRFGLCYFSIKECLERGLVLKRFSAGVAYDSRRVLQTQVGELENFLDEMLLIARTREYVHIVAAIRKKVSRRENISFFIEDQLFSMGWIHELGGFIFQRCSSRYLSETDIAATIRL